MRNVDTIAEELVYLLPYDTSRHVFIMNKYRIEHGMPPDGRSIDIRSGLGRVWRNTRGWKMKNK